MAAATQPTEAATEQEPGGWIRLLEVEPRLASGLTRRTLQEARRRLVAPVLHLPAGPIDTQRLRGERSGFAILIIDGAISHDIKLGDVTASLLLGPGDLCRPWAPHRGGVTSSVRWAAQMPSIVALLDVAFLGASRRWPQLTAGLFARAAETTERLALQATILHMPRVEDRIRLTLWQLADIWGRVGPDGVLLAIPMTHRMIGRLVGASRPTTTLALGALERGGCLRRTPDGAWLLIGHPRAGSIAQRAPARQATDADVTALRERLAQMRSEQQVRLARAQRELERSRSIRGDSAALRASAREKRRPLG